MTTVPDPPTSLPSPIVTTPRLIIRPMSPVDAPYSHAAACTPSISHYMTLSFPSPYTLEAAQTWISMNLAPPLNHFFICERERPEIVFGGIGIKPGSDIHGHTAEVGYWIGVDWQGKGLMREALSAFTAWCFTTREHPAPAHPGSGKELTRLSALVHGGNDASMRCLEACGYQAEGVMKGEVEKWGVVYDLHVYGLVKLDWDKWVEEKEGRDPRIMDR